MKAPTLNGRMGLKEIDNNTVDHSGNNNLPDPTKHNKLNPYSTCGCNSDKAHHRTVALQNGMDDAEHLRLDLTVDDLIKRWMNRERYGECPECSFAYVRGLLLKLKVLKQKAERK